MRVIEEGLEDMMSGLDQITGRLIATINAMEKGEVMEDILRITKGEVDNLMEAPSNFFF